MAVTTDYTLTHIRRVGTGKGPAIQTLRAHVCKTMYPAYMQRVLQSQPNLTILESAVETILESGGVVQGITLAEGSQIHARSVVLTTGTFLNGLCHEGSKKTSAARHGDAPAIGLSASLSFLGHRLRRFKTGTTPRISLKSIDTSKTPEMESETDTGGLSFLHDSPLPIRQMVPCFQTKTNPTTHALIKNKLNTSAMFSGQIQGIGPRYCPSIEDKIIRFSEKESHPIFLEQETWDGDEVYVQGVSTSLPAEVQLALLQTIDGLENVDMIRPGYAVEYDMADPLQLTPHLMSKNVRGLFLAGQVNGTSGYEEAAGQGIVAGINAARYAKNQEPITFHRTDSFIGVMVDDLTTKGVEDPYRMLTARSEHRLLLRHDNADERLTPLAKDLGLCNETRWAKFEAKQSQIEGGIRCLKSVCVGPQHSDQAEKLGLSAIKNKVTLFDLMRRPQATLETIQELAEMVGQPIYLTEDKELRDQIAMRGMYAGYMIQQDRLAENARKLDHLKIPSGYDYERIRGLSFESKEKLGRLRPSTVGQASRIPGVRPTDIALLVGFLRSRI
jgi:tRNA uridine 5-carboxymethylaminomethyl modification enzyme